MYLSHIEIENFRLFGSRADGRNLSFDLSPGVNLLIGPNDAGKTCVVDAIRLLVGTVTADYFAITEDDFHSQKGVRAQSLSILGEFRGLNTDEAAALLEYCGTERVNDKTEFILTLRLRANLVPPQKASPRKKRVRVELRAGPDEEGVRFEGQAREILSATYLRPLRDAVTELGARRGSRLSQVLRAYQHIEGHEVSDWNPESPSTVPTTLVGISRNADHHIRNTNVVIAAEQEINSKHLDAFSLGDTPLRSKIAPAGQELRQVLERLELSLVDGEANTSRGLGVYNLLFMATELLALAPSNDADLPLLLIEEPEAHLHPQYQQRLIEYINNQSKQSPLDGRDRLQVVLTSHSPHFASQVSLANTIVIHGGRAFSLAPAHTHLQATDYEFLSRFLDVTKANLFFARGVIIVEGDAEALLLPIIAKKIGRPLDRYGVSIVNVGHVGLFRYSRIFQRNKPPEMPVRVACITDRDIPPLDAAPYLTSGRRTFDAFTEEEIQEHIASRKQNDGQGVRTFVSNWWTFEYDLARAGLGRLMAVAIALAKQSKSKKAFPTGSEYESCDRDARKQYRSLRRSTFNNDKLAADIYEPLARKQASKPETAQVFARLLEKLPVADLRRLLPSYLVDAIDYVTGSVE